MTVSEIPRAEPEARAGEVLTSLAGRTFESATEVVVLDGERLVGLVPIERRRDPAYGSGPLATVIQGLLSVIVYFSVAAALV